MLIYKIYKNDDPIKTTEKHILHKSKAIKYFNNLINTEEKRVAINKLTQEEWINELEDIKLAYGENSKYIIDNNKQVVQCEYISEFTKQNIIVAIMMYKYIDEEDGYESICSRLFYIKEIEVEE